MTLEASPAMVVKGETDEPRSLSWVFSPLNSRRRPPGARREHLQEARDPARRPHARKDDEGKGIPLARVIDDRSQLVHIRRDELLELAEIVDAATARGGLGEAAARHSGLQPVAEVVQALMVPHGALSRR